MPVSPTMRKMADEIGRATAVVGDEDPFWRGSRAAEAVRRKVESQ